MACSREGGTPRSVEGSDVVASVFQVLAQGGVPQGGVPQEVADFSASESPRITSPAFFEQTTPAFFEQNKQRELRLRAVKRLELGCREVPLVP